MAQIYDPIDQDEPFDLALIEAGGRVLLPPGVIDVPRALKPPRDKPLRLIGQASTLRLTVDLPPGEALLTIAGNTDDGKLSPVANWELNDVILDGNGKTGDGLHLLYAVEGSVWKSKVVGFKGHGIYARSLWDSCFFHLQVPRCGSAPVLDETGAIVTPGFEALHLADQEQAPGVIMPPGLPAWLTSNNNHFFGCRFENSPYILTYLGKSATRNQFVACKWHGQLTHDTPSTAAPFDHVVLSGHGNTINACNLTRCGAAAVRIGPGGYDSIVTSNTFSTCDEAGIVVKGKPPNLQIMGNAFAAELRKAKKTLREEP